MGAVVLYALDSLFARGTLRACISFADLRSIARREAAPDLASVEAAILETNGALTMFHADES